MSEGRGSFSGHIIDQDDVERAIAAFLAYGLKFYRKFAASPLADGCYLGASLTGLKLKFFGRSPAVDPSSFTFPQHDLVDPIRVPREPRLVARDELAKPGPVAKEITALFERTFRLKQAVYPPAKKDR